MLKIILLVFVILVLFFLYYFFIAKAPEQKNITWGVNFSQMQSENLKLDWKKNYLAILEDLGTKNIKLHTQWDFVEGKKDDFYFNDIDWQIKQAENYNASIIYVVGLKTGRWPECHAPNWFGDISKQQQQDEILKYIKEVVTRYKNSKSIIAWQVENEPLFNFGKCPAWYYDNNDFLKKEVAIVRSLDSAKPVIISDSGEQSFWFDAAKIGDIVGSTVYRKLWVNVSNIFGFYFTFPITPVFYYHKAQIIKYLFGKDVICGELQAEPWAYKTFYDVPLQEQEKTMNLEQFKSNINFAKQTGFKEFYLWGAEWWFWLKNKENQPQIWNYAKEIFQN